MKYKIELAKIEDITDIYKLIYDRCVWFEQKKFKGWGLNRYHNLINEKYFESHFITDKLYVIKENNKIVGSMLLKEDDKDFWEDDEASYYIHNLVTDINIKGIGKHLINFAIEKCKEDNKKFLRLDCYTESVFLNDYYKQVGFKYIKSGKIGNYEFNLLELEV